MVGLSGGLGVRFSASVAMCVVTRAFLAKKLGTYFEYFINSAQKSMVHFAAITIVRVLNPTQKMKRVLKGLLLYFEDPI